jgi:rhamnulokinase
MEKAWRMTREYRFLAFDLGAESGRAVLGTLAGGRIVLEEIHRFRTEGLIMLGVRQWDLARIYEEMLAALSICAREHTPRLDGIGIDTWGVDFGLVARDGTVLANPRAYRDRRNEGMQAVAFGRMPREEIYRRTGIQFLVFNSVYQLLSMVEAKSPLLEAADALLLMGDLLGYLLSGRQVCEYSNATTTQMVDARTGRWDEELIARLGLPRRLLRDIVPPGTVLGPILPEIAAQTGIDPATPIIAPATHDTGSAIAAVPAVDAGGGWAYLSSGTWSLMGAELEAPCINALSLKYDFTNEGGVNGTIRFLKNIFGLWLVQECRRAWERAGDRVDYARMTEEAADSPAFAALFDMDDPRLLAPGDMPELIRVLCRAGGFAAPESRGAIVRAALESLALKYRRTLRAMDETLDRKTERLHIIGGGVQNRLLNQMTADACGVPVVAGPVEATALGNIGVQAMAVGALPSLSALRRVIADSFALENYFPENAARWAAIDRGAGMA